MPRIASCTEVVKKLDDARVRALHGDAEGLHDTRTALRRLRVWLRLGGHRRLEKELQWLTNELAPLRDLDVLDAVLTPEARAAMRPAAEQQAYDALDSRRWWKARKALQKRERPKRGKAWRKLKVWQARLEHFEVELEADSIHRLRRLARRVRDAREWLGLDAKREKALQRFLGPACDVFLVERTGGAQLQKTQANTASPSRTGARSSSHAPTGSV